MRRHTTAILLALATATLNAPADTADSFNNWKTYMAYGDITDIEPTGQQVYVLSSGDLFSYTISDGSVTTYDKVYPLSDCTISKIAWNSTAKKLIIVYDNYNIDLLDNKQNVENIPDYSNKTMNSSKNVNDIFINGNIAYLCTAFGLVQVDMQNALIRETINIGMNVKACAFKGDYIYIDTDNGVFVGSTKDNLLDRNNWKTTTESIVFTNANTATISSDNGYTQYTVYDKTNRCYWTNQNDQKLQAYTVSTDGSSTIIHQDINPVAPKYNTIGYMKLHNGKIYTCNGGEWDYNNPAAVQIYNLEDNSWTTYENTGISEKYNVVYRDILSLEVDPQDDNHVMVGCQSGLYEFQNGKQTNRFDHKNSPISSVEGLEDDDNYQIITSLFYDKDNTLWIMNMQAEKPILKYNAKSSSWSEPSQTLPRAQINNAKFMGYDSVGRLWFHTGRHANPGVYCYSADMSTLYKYTTFVNEDNTSISGIAGCKSLAEDKDGNIWVGSNVGLLLLNEEYQRDPSKGFYQVKVPRNDGTNYADYLLAGLDIATIAIDNANRKWVGTSTDGVYVISADNMVQEAHFQSSNSCLLSDVVEKIVINNETGTVYIGTDKGLCSVESNASKTNDNMSKDNVWAYPNPVKPEYTGLITIVGLSYNADVKITTTNGVIVAEGRSTGGSFHWDGCDKKGKRVASGVYMVNTATESGDSGTVCKIAVIN